MFKRLAKWIGLVLLTLLLLAALLWVLSRVVYPTAAQREAVASMSDLGQPEGRNAFGLLWTIDRAVPESEISQVIETDKHFIPGLHSDARLGG